MTYYSFIVANNIDDGVSSVIIITSSRRCRLFIRGISGRRRWHACNIGRRSRVVARLRGEEEGVDGEDEAAVGVDPSAQITEPPGHAPAPQHAREQRAPVVGLDEVVRIPERIGDLMPQLLQVLLLHDPAARWGEQEHGEHLHALLELPAFLRDLAQPEEAGRDDGDERDGIQPQKLKQVRRLPDDAPKPRHVTWH